MDYPDTHHARTADGAYIAFQVTGDGPIDFVWQSDWPGNIDVELEEPVVAPFFAEMSRFGRNIRCDRRGVGLSSRYVAPPNLETRVTDLLTVMDAVGSERPVLGGLNEAGSVNALLAATMPERVHPIVWFDPQPRRTWAPDYPWGYTATDFERAMRDIDLWGTGGGRSLLRPLPCT